jgi:histidinol-phosphate aminotransferase
VAQPHIIEQLVKVKDSYNCDSLSIAGATAAIDDQAWLADNRAKVFATRAWLTAGLKKLGFATVDSQFDAADRLIHRFRGREDSCTLWS